MTQDPTLRKAADDAVAAAVASADDDTDELTGVVARVTRVTPASSRTTRPRRSCSTPRGAWPTGGTACR